ncbi:hypothetical protein J2129_000482 [Methanofollis sp. W23]|nr:hypothetical protein [Methanofollis sp. W23]
MNPWITHTRLNMIVGLQGVWTCAPPSSFRATPWGNTASLPPPPCRGGSGGAHPSSRLSISSVETLLTVLFAGGLAAPRTPRTRIGRGRQPPLHGHFLPSQPYRGPGGPGAAPPARLCGKAIESPLHREKVKVSTKPVNPRDDALRQGHAAPAHVSDSRIVRGRHPDFSRSFIQFSRLHRRPGGSTGRTPETYGTAGDMYSLYTVGEGFYRAEKSQILS